MISHVQNETNVITCIGFSKQAGDLDGVGPGCFRPLLAIRTPVRVQHLHNLLEKIEKRPITRKTRSTKHVPTIDQQQLLQTLIESTSSNTRRTPFQTPTNALLMFFGVVSNMLGPSNSYRAYRNGLWYHHGRRKTKHEKTLENTLEILEKMENLMKNFIFGA